MLRWLLLVWIYVVAFLSINHVGALSLIGVRAALILPPVLLRLLGAARDGALGRLGPPRDHV